MAKSLLDDINECLGQLAAGDAASRARARWRIGELLGGSTSSKREFLPRDVLPQGQDAKQWVDQQKNTEAKLMAIRILGSANSDWHDEAVGALLDIAANPAAAVDERAWALYALSCQRRKVPENDRKILIKVLNDQEAKVRQWAAFALGRLTSEPPSSSKATLAVSAYGTVEEELANRWQVEIDTYVCRALVAAMGSAGGYAAPTGDGAGPAVALLQLAIQNRHSDVWAELPAAVSGVARNVTERSGLDGKDRYKILDALLQALQDWLKRPPGQYDAYRGAIRTIIGLVSLMVSKEYPGLKPLAVKGLNLLLDLAESPDYPIPDDLRDPVQERSLMALANLRERLSKEEARQLTDLLDGVVVPRLKCMLCRESDDGAAHVLRALTRLMGVEDAARFYTDVILEDEPAAAAARHHLEFLDKLTAEPSLRDDVFIHLRDGTMTKAAAQDRLEERARQRAAQSLRGIGEGAQSESFKRLDKALQLQVSPAYERAQEALSGMGGSAAAAALVAAARRDWVETKFFTPIEKADEEGKVLLSDTARMSKQSWLFTMIASGVVIVAGIILLIITFSKIDTTGANDLAALATGLGGLVAVVVGMLTPFLWNAAAAVQKGSAEMTRLVTSFHGYMGRMRLLGLGFADLSTRQQADVQVITTIANAAGDAMLDSAGVLSQVSVWPSGKGMVKVPDVAGKTWAEAAALAEERGLEVTLKKLEYSDTDEGKVSAQSPSANSTVETGTVIELTLSKGKEEEAKAKAAEVPDLKGKSWADAEAAAKGKELTVSYAGSRFDAAAKDTVIEQQPPAGTKVVTGSAVALTLSNGKEETKTMEVPPLKGMSWANAEIAAKAKDLTVSYGGARFDAAAKGTVIEQQPPAGAQVAAGSAVTLTLSDGLEPAVLHAVPALKGKKVGDAHDALAAEKLVLNIAEFAQDATVGDGMIISQDIASGIRVAEGTKVSVIVSKGA